MFAPPICRRRWRNNAFPFRQIQRRRRQPANIAASGASKFDPRCSRRRSAGGDGGTTLFRSARSDEDGGNPANIAIKQSAMREQLNARAASVGNRAPPHGGRREQRRSSSASDDDGGGFQA